MFRRRYPRPVHRTIREILWPSLGWGRAARYVGHRLGRLPGSPYRVAAGFACGAAVSFTPFMGFHFVLAMGLSLLMRGNVIASAIGTAVGNPWTFPFIWAWTLNLGMWFLGEVGRDGYAHNLTLSHIFDNPLQVLLPMTVGALPTAVVAWFVFYFPVRSLVAQYQKARRWRLRRKVLARQRRIAKLASKGEGGGPHTGTDPIGAGGGTGQAPRRESGTSGENSSAGQSDHDKKVASQRARL